MPFTLSHPAAVLPFLSRSRSVSWKAGLVIGAMSPDLWFLLPGMATRTMTHGRYGILLDPPAALLLTWICVQWILPRLSRLPGLESLDRKESFRWGVGYLGSVLGTATHLVWDQFTHGGSVLLSDPIFHTVIYRHGPVNVDLGLGIWYLNSFLGAAVLLAWLHRRMRARPEGSRTLLSRQWVLVGIVSLVPMAILLAWFGDETLSGPGGVRRALGLGSHVRVAGVMGIVSAVAAALLSSGWKSSENRKPYRQDGEK